MTEQLAVAVVQLDVVLEIAGLEPFLFRVRGLIGNERDLLGTAIVFQCAAADHFIRAVDVAARRVVRQRLMGLP